jgi:DNA-directed RNA polymerase sigma subunit (sigma70/sigma32)
MLNQSLMARRVLTGELGRSPTVAEIAERARLSVDKVEQTLRAAVPATSLDQTLSSEVAWGSLLPDTSARSPEESAVARDLSVTARRGLASLSGLQQRVIELRFGFRGGREHTLAEIGEILGMTRKRARQIERQAFEQLRRHYRATRTGRAA